MKNIISNIWLIVSHVVLWIWKSTSASTEPPFPSNLQGEWYSWELGQNVMVHINPSEADSWGTPLEHYSSRYDTHEYIFKKSSGCFVCSKFIVRSWNILERIDSQCRTSFALSKEERKLIKENGCGLVFKIRSQESEISSSKTFLQHRGHIMYRQNPSPLNCRHFIYGSFTFSYQMTDSFTGYCSSHKSRLYSCDTPGTQFSISNQRFLMDFHNCEGGKNLYGGSGDYSCLGEWREGLQHFFVAANLKESRKEERYRCFLTNREDPYYIGMSRSPSCNYLRTPGESPVKIKVRPLQTVVDASCFLPSNISGDWISSGEGEPSVKINLTHIVESRWVGHQLRNDINVCVEKKGDRILMAKVSESGCQTEYVCWNILPRHQNVVRYRKSRTMIHRTFEVCDYGNYGNKIHWKYDTLIAEVPHPIECPFSGRFTFGQKGANPLEKRVVGGITASPLDTYECHHRETDLAICDRERKNLIIDLDYCQTLNRDGHPVEIQSIPDYHLQCVGFWKENLVSYLITHDPSDSVSRFRCWVYQRISIIELRLSQGLGSACGLYQTHSSDTLEEGASIALNLTLHERLYDQCPMYYDDGKNPWKPVETTLQIFTFNRATKNTHFLHVLLFINFMHFLLCCKNTLHS